LVDEIVPVGILLKQLERPLDGRVVLLREEIAFDAKAKRIPLPEQLPKLVDRPPPAASKARHAGIVRAS
jgi:hypothetical protein